MGRDFSLRLSSTAFLNAGDCAVSGILDRLRCWIVAGEYWGWGASGGCGGGGQVVGEMVDLSAEG